MEKCLSPGSLRSLFHLHLLATELLVLILQEVSIPTFQQAAAQMPFIVTALALQPNGKILIGGAFTVLRGGNRKPIARLNSDSSVDVSFKASRSPDNTISTVLRKNINQRADREAFFKEIGTLIGEFDLEHHIGVCLLHNHNLVTSGHFMLGRIDKTSYSTPALVMQRIERAG